MDGNLEMALRAVDEARAFFDHDHTSASRQELATARQRLGMLLYDRKYLTRKSLGDLLFHLRGEEPSRSVGDVDQDELSELGQAQVALDQEQERQLQELLDKDHNLIRKLDGQAHHRAAARLGTEQAA